jgi:UDP-glucose:(heptosyl)LPS alpha-1,3-glucosyltransferase
MRIAFVLFHWFPYGGLQQDLVKIVNACAEQAACKIYCLSWQGAPLPNAVVEEVKVSGFTRVARQQAFARYIEKEVRPQHLLVVGFNRMPGLDYYFAADSCFAYKAYRERSWWYRQTPRARQHLQFEAAVFGTQSSTISLLLSQRQREQYQQQYQTPAARLVDLPAGIHRKHQAGADAAGVRAQFRAEHNIAADALVVLQIGSSFSTKGLDRSLLALAALPLALRETLYFFVMGQDKQLARWQQQAAQVGLGARLQFLPPTQAIPTVMQGADVLLHPSLHESAGMVILEAVVAGLPVLTTASCGYAEHVRRAQAGLVCDEPFQQRQLNTLLLQMLSADRSAWRQQGIAYGQQHNLYDMPTVVAGLLLKSAAARVLKSAVARGAR